MTDEPHYPSKWTVAAVLFVIILMIGGVFVWAFWLNTGSITLKASKSFTADVNGSTTDCSTAECSFILPPNTYTIVAHATGSYDEKFTIEVSRWDSFEKTISFRVIPFLKEISANDLPPVPNSILSFSKSDGGLTSLMRDQDGIVAAVTSFESLKDPQIQTAGDLALVIDQGRVFFVSISDGRKLRRFDDSVSVEQALITDNAKKILFFVKSNGLDQLWLWFNETSELILLPWYAPPTLIQWESGTDYRLFVISDTLKPTDQTSVIDQVLTSVDTAQQNKLLLQANLDTSEVVQLATFDNAKTPLNLQRRGDRYLVEYAGGSFDELVVR